MKELLFIYVLNRSSLSLSGADDVRWEPAAADDLSVRPSISISNHRPAIYSWSGLSNRTLIMHLATSRGLAIISPTDCAPSLFLANHNRFAWSWPALSAVCLLVCLVEWERELLDVCGRRAFYQSLPPRLILANSLQIPLFLLPLWVRWTCSESKFCE